VKGSIRLDHAGIGAILKGEEVRKAIDELAAEVAVKAIGSPSLDSRPGVEVKVEHYTTDRAAAAVVVKHPAGLGLEAKHGVLSRAARAAGLPFRSKRSGR
jgi:hypothetical protein